MTRYFLKEIMETDCTNLKDLKSRQESNQAFWSFYDSNFATTKNGETVLGVQKPSQQGEDWQGMALYTNL